MADKMVEPASRQQGFIGGQRGYIKSRFLVNIKPFRTQGKKEPSWEKGLDEALFLFYSAFYTSLISQRSFQVH
jgi:hypothetical protein